MEHTLSTLLMMSFMTEIQLLKENGLSEAEALDEVFSIGWWIEHLPLAGVFIDGIEQTDEGIERYEERHPSK